MRNQQNNSYPLLCVHRLSHVRTGPAPTGPKRTGTPQTVSCEPAPTGPKRTVNTVYATTRQHALASTMLDGQAWGASDWLPRLSRQNCTTLNLAGSAGRSGATLADGTTTPSESSSNTTPAFGLVFRRLHSPPSPSLSWLPPGLSAPSRRRPDLCTVCRRGDKRTAPPRICAPPARRRIRRTQT